MARPKTGNEENGRRLFVSGANWNDECLTWQKKPVYNVAALREASKSRNELGFATAAHELEFLRALAARFREIAFDEYRAFMLDYSARSKRDTSDR